jgi:hypothetical protein
MRSCLGQCVGKEYEVDRGDRVSMAAYGHDDLDSAGT